MVFASIIKGNIFLLHHFVSLACSLMVNGVTITKTVQTKLNACTTLLHFSMNFVNKTGLTENFATSTIISVKLGFKACVP